MVGLLDNFLNPKAFHSISKRFHKMAMTENGWGKERKINGGLAMANQVRDGLKS
jgi:hypothetical protein